MLRTHEMAHDIPPMTVIEVDSEDALELFRPEASLDAAASPSVPRSDPLTEGPRFTPCSNEPATWDLSYEPTDRDLQSPQPVLMSPARSRSFVWLLVSAPVAVFLVSWFATGAEFGRRTAIEAGDRVRSPIASMVAQTHNNSSSSEPIAEQPERPSPSIKGAARSPAPALSRVQASSPATKRLLAGTLSIDSRPVGASVFVDGQLVGTTPLLLPYISPGTHVVRLQLAAHQDWRATVQVVPDSRNRVTAALEKDENTPEP